MRRFLFLCVLGLFACSLPQVAISTPELAATPTSTLAATPTPQPTQPVGSEKNPLILALAPSPHPADDVVSAGRELSARLESLIGSHVVAVAPTSEAGLIQALHDGNTNIAILSPIAYEAAYVNGDARAALASTRNGEIFYGAQFVARERDGYESYYDPILDKNTADASVALLQFRDKKPCWSDPASPSGYVVPLGVLNQANIPTLPGAFVEGQPTVVRAIYSSGICDFGATYVDARDHPSLEADYPDVMERVEVIWRISKVIPYDVIVFSSHVTPELERSLLRAFVEIMATADGKAMIQKIYGIDELQIVQDAVYKDFHNFVSASGLELDGLLK